MLAQIVEKISAVICHAILKLSLIQVSVVKTISENKVNNVIIIFHSASENPSEFLE